MNLLTGLVSASSDPSRSGHLAAFVFLISLAAVVVTFLAGQPFYNNFIIPLAALILGAWLYATRPVLYLGFVWWVWFLTPFLRRFVDYQVGTHNTMSFIMLCPYLVSGIAVLTLFRYGAELRATVFRPFGFAILGILYGFLIALVQVGVQGAIFALLDWLVPVFLGLHVALFWRRYPENRRMLTNTLVWGTLLMSTYGIYQYVFPPAWDMFWLLESKMWVTMGPPAPQQFRVFSTLNSTGPFAFVMIAGLLMLFSRKTVAGWLAIVPGYLSIMLTLVRAAWGGWIVGLVYMIIRMRGRLRRHLLFTLTGGVLVLIPILILSPSTTERIGTRANTIQNLEEDGSFQDRFALYVQAAPRILQNPLGNGIGSTGRAAKLENEDGTVVSFDSGIFDVLLSLGWIGSLFYVGGITAIFVSLLQVDAESTDQFTIISASIALSFFAMMLFVNMMIGVTGAIAWTFMGMVIASRKHHAVRRPSPAHHLSPS